MKVAVFETEEWEQQTIYIPLSTAQLLLTWGPRGGTAGGRWHFPNSRLGREEPPDGRRAPAYGMRT